MPRLTPRQIKALETKQKILETALDLFSKKGFDQVTVDEIVSASQSSKGAFYVHFKSKFEIFHEKFKEIDDFYQTFTESLPSELSYKEKIIRLFTSQMIFLRDDLGIDLMRTVYMSSLIPNQPNDYLSNTDRTLYKIIHSFVLGGQESGEFTTDLSTNEITMLITRSMRGTLYDWFIFNEKYNLIHEAQKFIALVLEGIKK